MPTVILSSAGAPEGRFFTGIANSTRLVLLPSGVTPHTLATRMAGGGEAFLTYLRQIGLPDAAAAQIEGMYIASSAFRFGEFEYIVAEEAATLWAELEALGARLLEFL